MTSQAARLRLYSRSYCHLCHDMQLALEALRDELLDIGTGFSIEVVDVDSDPQWVARYDELVPVLVLLENAGERELCHYFLDREAVIEGLG